MAGMDFLPFARPSIGEEEIAEVVDTLRSGWLTTGPKVARFEKEFAAFVGAPHALAVNSATSGLHLALEAVGVEPGDRVVTTPYTFTATAEVVRYLGADPLFVDVDPETLNIDPGRVEDALAGGSRIKALLPVHFAGLACDMGRLLAAGRRHGVAVVEDAAHALPATSGGRMIGTHGDLTVYSFYVTKPVATGEGGMVVTASPEYDGRMRTMSLHGINRNVFERYSSTAPSWYYEVVAPGFKYNMTDVAAGIGIHQLGRAWAFQQRRQAIAEAYSEAFADLPLKRPAAAGPGETGAWHLYVIRLELERLEIGRDEFIELMTGEGIGTSVHFIPLHIQPYWRERYGFRPEDFPVAFEGYRRAVSLPIYPGMTGFDVERVVAAVKRILLDHQK